ncbi:hypothetical protein PYCCODRAFT_1440941 [Trametes coccinea BRFM310]|uniref:Uncharacterized protein n=1 Tax=Trametes coccinea (strain BRFM310) TaxID=1353009 RepID=A0A1Y2I646_TRAC3|nr:hypothetical protein PYCCODRAFT_1440941 [Trametes coccinea BRFM310]
MTRLWHRVAEGGCPPCDWYSSGSADATGRTGQDIVQSRLLLPQHIAARVQPASPKRPTTNALRVSGVEVRTGNHHGGAKKLTKGMSEVDILNDAASRRKETEIQL